MHKPWITVLDGVGASATILFVLARLFLPSSTPTPTAACGFTDAALQFNPDAAIVVSVWAEAVTDSCWRAFVPLLAARQLADSTIGIDLHPINYSERKEYNAALAAAATSEHSPAIASLHSWYVDDFVRQGLLRPVDDCLAQYDEFQGIISELWPIFAQDGHIWAIPTQLDLLLFFFNKPMLRTLGWSEEQIDQLPAHIASGQFTRDDLVLTARQAVAAGVVQPEFAYWPSYTKLRHFWPIYKAYGGQRANWQGQVVIDQNALQQAYAFHALILDEGWHIPHAAGSDNSLGSWPTGALWRETVANGRVLFWTGFMSQWTNWRQQAQVTNEAAWLAQTIGIALFPGKNGYTGQTFVDSIQTMVMLEDGITTPQVYNAACRLLAAISTPQLNRYSMQQENVLSALSIYQDPKVLQGLPYQQAASYMIDHIDWVDYNIEFPERANDVIRSTLIALELGQLTIDEAIAQVVTTLENEFGDGIVIRP